MEKACACGIASAAWAVALAIAVFCTWTTAPQEVALPWLLLVLSIGITATVWLMLERALFMAVGAIRAELDGDVSGRGLSVAPVRGRTGDL